MVETYVIFSPATQLILLGKEETVSSPCNVKNIDSVFVSESFCKNVIPVTLARTITNETIAIIIIFMIFIFSV
jgi:hypothetical protein